MFTGIVTDVGRVRSVRDTNRDRRFEIETGFDTGTIDIGALAVAALAQAPHFRRVEVRPLGDDLWERYERG